MLLVKPLAQATAFDPAVHEITTPAQHSYILPSLLAPMLKKHSSLSVYLYVCIYTHAPHHRKRPILQGLICSQFCCGLFLFCCSCGFRAGFVGFRESLDALGNVLQKCTFSPCILHSSHQVLKSQCTGFPLLKWTPNILCFWLIPLIYASRVRQRNRRASWTPSCISSGSNWATAQHQMLWMG